MNVILLPIAGTVIFGVLFGFFFARGWYDKEIEHYKRYVRRKK